MPTTTGARLYLPVKLTSAPTCLRRERRFGTQDGTVLWRVLIPLASWAKVHARHGPDLVEGAPAHEMRQMSPVTGYVAQACKPRVHGGTPRFVEILKTINVPTLLLVTGERVEDLLPPGRETRRSLCRQHIAGSQLKVIPESRTLFALGASGKCGDSAAAVSGFHIGIL